MTQDLAFEQFLQKEFDSVSERSFPMLHVDEEADCFEVFLTDEPYYGERVDSRVTIYRGQESGDLVGILLKSANSWVMRILNEFEQLQCGVVDGEIQLGLLFTIEQAKEQAKENDSPLVMTYRTIAKNTWAVSMKIPELSKVH
jgi:hypothetical protein